jgi:hypothetical protein
MFLYFLTVMMRGYFESISCDIAFTTEEEAFKRKCFQMWKCRVSEIKLLEIWYIK